VSTPRGRRPPLRDCLDGDPVPDVLVGAAGGAPGYAGPIVGEVFRLGAPPSGDLGDRAEQWVPAPGLGHSVAGWWAWARA
jgi:hypothetical protein